MCVCACVSVCACVRVCVCVCVPACVYITTHHNATEITGLKLGDSQVNSLEHIGPQSLPQQSIEVNGPSQELDVPLLQDGGIAIGRRVGKLVGCGLSTKTLVQINTAGERVC